MLEDGGQKSKHGKEETGKQLIIEAVLAVKRDDLVHSSSDSSDNATDF